MNEAVIVTDLEGAIHYWNSGAEALYGWDASEAIGRSVLELTPAPTALEQAEQILAVLREGRPWAGRFPVRRRDGTIFVAQVTDMPWLDPDGQLRGVIGVSFDAERQVDHLAAERRTQARDEFLALLAHELREPLTPILASLELIGRSSEDLASIERHRRVILRQIGRISRLTEDLLEYERAARGMVSLKIEPVDLRVAIDEAVDLAHPRARAKDQDLRVEVAESLVVDGDVDRLAQVFGNLLSNAVRYTPPRGSIRVRAGRAGAVAVVRVADTGDGLSQEALGRVFEPFVRAGRSRTDGLGMGLGLALVRRLVMLHGGEVSAHSEGLGRGAELTVRLPLRATP